MQNKTWYKYKQVVWKNSHLIPFIFLKASLNHRRQHRTTVLIQSIPVLSHSLSGVDRSHGLFLNGEGGSRRGSGLSPSSGLVVRIPLVLVLQLGLFRWWGWTGYWRRDGLFSSECAAVTYSLSLSVYQHVRFSGGASLLCS